MIPDTAYKKPKLLFVGESVSLAHVSRPYALASSLDKNLFDIHFASDNYFRKLCDTLEFTWHSIPSITPQEFLKRLKLGHLLYDKHTLTKYVLDDLALLSSICPDIVIGDMRLSLSVSAEALNIPYIAITHAHWSKYAIQHSVIPPYKFLQMTGAHNEKNKLRHQLALKLIEFAKPRILSEHLRPINYLRKQYGLKTFDSFFDGFTYGTFSLFADTPSISPLTKIEAHCKYIGAVTWSPTITETISISSLQKPYIYITLGSSGDLNLLKQIALALKDIPYHVFLASVVPPNTSKASFPPNFTVKQFLNGNQLAKKAKLVICNGGSPTAYQALRHGVPVLGLANNLDQILIMSNIEKAGAGKLLRSDYATAMSIKKNTMDIIDNQEYKLRADVIAKEFLDYNATLILTDTIKDILNSEGRLHDQKRACIL